MDKANGGDSPCWCNFGFSVPLKNVITKLGLIQKKINASLLSDVLDDSYIIFEVKFYKRLI